MVGGKQDNGEVERGKLQGEQGGSRKKMIKIDNLDVKFGMR